jgi:hypothetical protein
VRLRDVSLKVIWEKQLNKHLLPPPQAELEAPAVSAHPPGRGLIPPSVSESVMTSDDSLSLILRRLDEIERQLDRMMEEVRPTAIGYSARRGNRPRKD